MARMREPYTGTVFDVVPKKVEKRLAAGWALLDGDVPAPVDAADEADPEPEAPEAAEAEPMNGDEGQDAGVKPTAESTIAEIRAYAKAHGVELPKKGNKAALLAALD